MAGWVENRRGKKSHGCPVCREVFGAKRELEGHMEVHPVCARCRLRCATEKEYLRHMDLMHDEFTEIVFKAPGQPHRVSLLYTLGDYETTELMEKIKDDEFVARVKVKGQRFLFCFIIDDQEFRVANNVPTVDEMPRKNVIEEGTQLQGTLPCSGHSFYQRVSSEMSQYSGTHDGSAGASACTAIAMEAIGRIMAGDVPKSVEKIDEILAAGKEVYREVQMNLSGTMRQIEHLDPSQVFTMSERIAEGVDHVGWCMGQGSLDAFEHANKLMRWFERTKISIGATFTMRNVTIALAANSLNGFQFLFDSHNMDYGDGEPKGASLIAFKDSSQMRDFLKEKFPKIDGVEMWMMDAYELNFFVAKNALKGREKALKVAREMFQGVEGSVATTGSALPHKTSNIAKSPHNAAQSPSVSSPPHQTVLQTVPPDVPQIVPPPLVNGLFTAIKSAQLSCEKLVKRIENTPDEHSDIKKQVQACLYTLQVILGTSWTVLNEFWNIIKSSTGGEAFRQVHALCELVDFEERQFNCILNVLENGDHDVQEFGKCLGLQREGVEQLKAQSTRDFSPGNEENCGHSQQGGGIDDRKGKGGGEGSNSGSVGQQVVNESRNGQLSNEKTDVGKAAAEEPEPESAQDMRGDDMDIDETEGPTSPPTSARGVNETVTNAEGLNGVAGVPLESTSGGAQHRSTEHALQNGTEGPSTANSATVWNPMSNLTISVYEPHIELLMKEKHLERSIEASQAPAQNLAIVCCTCKSVISRSLLLLNVKARVHDQQCKVTKPAFGFRSISNVEGRFDKDALDSRNVLQCKKCTTVVGALSRVHRQGDVECGQCKHRVHAKTASPQFSDKNLFVVGNELEMYFLYADKIDVEQALRGF